MSKSNMHRITTLYRVVIIVTTNKGVRVSWSKANYKETPKRFTKISGAALGKTTISKDDLDKPQNGSGFISNTMVITYSRNLSTAFEATKAYVDRHIIDSVTSVTRIHEHWKKSFGTLKLGPEKLHALDRH